MVHFGTPALLEPERLAQPFSDKVSRPTLSVLMVRDDDKNNYLLDVICEFFDIGVEHVSSSEDIAPLLRAARPMAVIADVDGAGQDGYHVMKTVAEHDRGLPVLLLSDNDPALLGAVDAVREVWGLTQVMTVSGAGDIGLVVDFLCRAARDAGMSRMMRI